MKVLRLSDLPQIPEASSWRLPSGTPSLPEVHRSLPIPAGAGPWRKLIAFAGPGFLVAVGYMDPGNWATDLAAGAKFNYSLLFVVMLSNLMAILLQSLAIKLGVVTGRDLAQACRDHFSRPMALFLWIGCEIAIAACDLAEVIGSAIGLQLLFGIPLLIGVCVTALDVLLILYLQNRGFRYIEALVIALIGVVGVCFGLEMFFSRPEFAAIAHGMFVPSANILRNPDMLYIAIGILGATVMPHNLYLHSALVQSRKLQQDEASMRRAVRFNTIDSVVALTIAFFINAAILVLAAIVFFGKQSVLTPDGHLVTFSADSDWIRVAYLTLAPLVGAAAASTLFAVALLASGQSSTITGTLAGQVVMEGFMHWRIEPWVRRLITRSLAILPAVLVIGLRGESSVTDLLVLSQVVLALQLPFAMFPLLQFTSSRKRMGMWKNGWFLMATGWASAILITILDIYGLPESLRSAWQVISGR
jgi:manganese transport protein